jgi:UDP-N-acetyl-2-amino-2-deoxyglucuronate dehydrogenase
LTATDFKIAIVGCGTIAPTHADAIAEISQTTAARIVACCDVDAGRAAAFAKRFDVPAVDWQSILADPAIDAVSLCTPSGLHADLGAEALLAGKHVVVEKPLDVTLAACDKLIDAQQHSGKVLACISQHRFDPASVYVYDKIRTGELGDVFLTEARVSWYRTQEYYDSGDWRGTWQLDGGGCLMNQGVHTVDLMLWLCGPATSVYAQARTAAHKQIEVEDVIAATVTFESGAVGNLLATTAAYPGFPVRLAVHGTKGTAVIEGDALQCYAAVGHDLISGPAPGTHAVGIATGGTSSMAIPVGRDEPRDTVVDPVEPALPGAPPTWGDSHRRQLAEFIECCRTGARPRVDGPQGRAAVELILAAYESAKTGMPVSVSIN